MSHYTYEVIKEIPGGNLSAYSITEVVDRFDNPSEALKLCDSLRTPILEGADTDEWYYVQVQWGSIDNV